MNYSQLEDYAQYLKDEELVKLAKIFRDHEWRGEKTCKDCKNFFCNGYIVHTYEKACVDFEAK